LFHSQRNLPALLVSLVGQSLCLRCSCLLMLLLCKRCTQAAVLLVLQTSKSGLALQSPQSLVGKPDVEVAAAKPQENGLGCRHLSCKSSAFGHKVTSSLLVEKALMMCSFLAGSLLALVGGTLGKEVLAVSGILFFASSLLVKMALAGCRLEATVLVRPKGVNCPLPILVGMFREGASPMKNGPTR
jgi:hypothetical protein